MMQPDTITIVPTHHHAFKEENIDVESGREMELNERIIHSHKAPEEEIIFYLESGQEEKGIKSAPKEDMIEKESDKEGEADGQIIMDNPALREATTDNEYDKEGQTAAHPSPKGQTNNQLIQTSVDEEESGQEVTISIPNTMDDPQDFDELSPILALFSPSPRARACILMTIAMSLHLGGFEFARASTTALFISRKTGFDHASAYPLAIALVTPTNILLLYWYRITLKSSGPKVALQRSNYLVLAILTGGGALVALLTSQILSWSTTIAWITRGIVSFLFVFQNSYNSLLYTQQWSFLGTVMSPSEGRKWFTLIAGWTSLVCTVTGCFVTFIAKWSHGLILLIFMTSFLLGLSMVCANKAYKLSSEYGFDPTEEMNAKNLRAENTQCNETKQESLLSKSRSMFKTSPTLAWLFGEVITFQSLLIILNAFIVNQTRQSIPVDGDRASFIGLYSGCLSGATAIMQIFLVPLLRKCLEPRWVYRLLPVALVPILIYTAVSSGNESTPKIASERYVITHGLFLASAVSITIKVLNFSLRGISMELVYQPLDFNARYVGKQIIGLFAKQLGKSGTSIILSGLGWMGLVIDPQLALGVGVIWSATSISLSWHVVTNSEAEEQVQQRKSDIYLPRNSF